MNGELSKLQILHYYPTHKCTHVTKVRKFFVYWNCEYPSFKKCGLGKIQINDNSKNIKEHEAKDRRDEKKRGLEKNQKILGCGLGSNHKTPSQLNSLKPKSRTQCSTVRALLAERLIQPRTPGIQIREITQ